MSQNPNFEAMELLRYYDGLFLTAELCNIEQSFFLDTSKYLNSILFNSGTVAGLEATLSSNKLAVEISSGMAIDEDGNQLVWPAGGQAQEIPAGVSDGDLVSIQYQMVTAPTNQAIEKLLPKIQISSFGSDPNLVLAKLSVDSNHKVTGITDQRTLVTLTVASANGGSGATEKAAASEAGVSRGVVTVDLGDGDPPDQLEQEVSFPAAANLGDAPWVQVTAQAARGSVIAASVSSTDAEGFVANLAPVAGGWGSEDVRLVWNAGPTGAP